MNELLLGSQKEKRLVIPTDTGPGPQELIGYYAEDNGPGTQKGFYGETTASELITGDALASLVGLTTGTTQNSDGGWLKFLLDDQIYFVAKQPYRHTISWEQLDIAAVVNDNKIVSIRARNYSVGLLKGLGPDRSDLTTGADAPITHRSEWNRLMYNIAQPLGNANDIRDSQIGDQWANYDQGSSTNGLWLNAGNGRYSWCKEVWPVGVTPRIVLRGFSSVSALGETWYNTSNFNYGWRPRLILTQPI